MTAAAAPNPTFLREAEDLLEQIEGGALTLEKSPEDAETINLLFRAFHTIKGSAGMVGLDAVSTFTHHVENMLDQVRNELLAVTPEMISIVLAAKDHIASLLESASSGGEPDQARGNEILANLAALGGGDASGAAQTAAAAGPTLRTTYLIRFRLARSSTGIDVDPRSLIEELRTLGTCQAQEREAQDARFGATYEVELTTTADVRAVRDVFIFAPEGSELSVEPGLSEFVTAPPPANDVPAAVAKLKARPPAASPAKQAPDRKQATVRVLSEKLDQLVNLVGELVINQSRLQQAHAHGSAQDLAGPVEAMDRLISELRDSVFGIRMMPIGPTFQRFNRLVRDLSAELGKEIALVTEGNETGLDKTVLDQLGDPLVHLLRNSMDHGIEMPAERIAAGKPAAGRILLTAAHEGGQVVITIKDDGRGLDPAKLRAKAEEKGLIEPGAHLTEQETFELIMRPGFSTATTITQVSGRGVGMDVVKKTVEGLRGTLSLTSVLGQGTIIRLTLPLTLAIIDGLVVEVGDANFIVPMAAVTENVELERAQRSKSGGRNAISVRGELVPYVRLRELFSTQSEGPDVEKIVIVALDGQRLGLVVDDVVGSHQTVIQPLGPLYRQVEMFSGTTIMGDGRVVMILDLAGTLRRAERTRAADGFH